MPKHGGWPSTGFGLALKREREAAGVTREQLAQTAGCALQTVVKVENGYQEPAWPLVLAFADALKVSVEVFRRVPDVVKKRPVGRPRKAQPSVTPLPEQTEHPPQQDQEHPPESGRASPKARKARKKKEADQ